jgi:lipoprotein NlpI
MLRTLGELRKTKPTPARWRQLVAYYNRTPRDGPYELAGQFLVGRATETELLSRADTPQRRTEDGYYLGVKALSEGRYEDASAWLRVAIETRQVHEAEFVLAKELLERWTESQKSLERGVVWLRKL